MNNQIGIDSTGTWTPHQYVIDAGWDFTCIEATAAKGVSEADAEGLTGEQQDALLGFCKTRVERDTYSFATDSTSGTLTAKSLDAAYDQLRAKITDAMIDDGATLWVESAEGDRLTLGVNAE